VFDDVSPEIIPKVVHKEVKERRTKKKFELIRRNLSKMLKVMKQKITTKNVYILVYRKEKEECIIIKMSISGDEKLEEDDAARRQR
jgi:hypothetical protein